MQWLFARRLQGRVALRPLFCYAKFLALTCTILKISQS